MAEYVSSVIITDGSGSAKVTDNMLEVRPRSRFQYAVDKGDAYAWGAITKDWTAIDTLLGLENNSTVKSLYIQRICIGTDTASQIVVYGQSGITVAGTNAITGVNLNRGSSKVAPATCYDDETGATETATYLTRFYQSSTIADSMLDIQFNGSIVLAYDSYLGIDLVAESTGGNATIWGWFE